MDSNNYRIVCLGTYCLPRVITTMLNLKPRKAAGEKTCPFDMCFSWDFNGILNLLDEEFANFFNDIKYDYFENQEIKAELLEIFGNPTAIKTWIHTKANIFFNHEAIFPEKEKFTEIYERRIKNLYEYLKETDKKLYIVIASFNVISQKQIERLNSIIERYRPKDSFEIILIDQSATKTEISLPNTHIIDGTKPEHRKLFKSNWVKLLEDHHKWREATEFYHILEESLNKFIVSR